MYIIINTGKNKFYFQHCSFILKHDLNQWVEFVCRLLYIKVSFMSFRVREFRGMCGKGVPLIPSSRPQGALTLL